MNPSTKTWREVIEGIEVEILEFTDTVETVEKASRLSGYPESQIVKTLLLKTRDGYVVVIVRGDRRVDFNKARHILGKEASLASPSEVERVLGVQVGAVTPLSPRIRGLRVIVDPAVTEHEYIVCGGGSLNRLYRVKTRDLLGYLNPEIMDIFT